MGATCSQFLSSFQIWRPAITYIDAYIVALAVKVISATPISMVDERVMSVVSRDMANSPRRMRQKVSTVANRIWSSVALIC